MCWWYSNDSLDPLAGRRCSVLMSWEQNSSFLGVSFLPLTENNGGGCSGVVGYSITCLFFPAAPPHSFRKMPLGESGTTVDAGVAPVRSL